MWSSPSCTTRTACAFAVFRPRFFLFRRNSFRAREKNCHCSLPIAFLLVADFFVVEIFTLIHVLAINAYTLSVASHFRVLHAHFVLSKVPNTRFNFQFQLRGKLNWVAIPNVYFVAGTQSLWRWLKIENVKAQLPAILNFWQLENFVKWKLISVISRSFNFIPHWFHRQFHRYSESNTDCLKLSK